MIRKKHIKYIALILFMAVFAISCVKKVGMLPPTAPPPAPGTVDTCTTDVKYAQHIAPIITKSCAKPGCHTPTGYKDFTTYALLKAEISAITAAGLYNRIKTGTDMPQGGPPLTSCEISKMKAWMDDGALNN